MADYYCQYKKRLTSEEMQVNAKWIYSYLRSKGWSVNAICACLGNWESECTLNPNRPQHSGFPTDTTGGFGLAQWTPWFKKYGKDMDDVRNDVVKLIEATKIQPEKKENPVFEEGAMYFVRKSWIDKKSQIGAFINLDNAKQARDKAGIEYEVYSATGDLIYPTVIEDSENFKVGDQVKLTQNAIWHTGESIPTWVFTKPLYVRRIQNNGIIAVSTVKVGGITGTIKPEYLDKITISSSTTTKPKANFKNYLVLITASSLNVRNGAGTQYRVNTTVKKGQVYTIVDEKNGWGKLKSGAGWISLQYTKKL